MDELRTSLLIVGLVAVVAIILWTRRRAAKNDDLIDDPHDVLMQNIPTLEEAIDDWDIRPINAKRNVQESLDETELRGMSPNSADEVTVEEPLAGDNANDDELIVVLTILALEGKVLKGNDIFRVMAGNGLKLGDRGVFQLRMGGAEDDDVLFSVANILEPGVFDSMKSEVLETPGLAVFMLLPGTLAGRDAFDRMLAGVRNLTFDLNGRLCNARREPLTDGEIERLRSEADRFQPIRR